MIKNFKSCPHCGGTSGYYTYFKVSGIIKDQHTFEGIAENSNMYDSLKYTYHIKYYRCLDCNKNICKI